MRRRDFITLIGCTAAAWPLAARAQRAGKVWRLGILDTATRELNTDNLAAFYKGLRNFGYVEGQNLIIEYRSANGRIEHLPDLVSELLRLNVDLIVVRGSPEVTALKNATSTIPVVMTAVADPVRLGVAVSLAHPGGNITGLSSFVTDLEAKRVELLKELVPGMKLMAVLGDFSNFAIANQWEEVQIAARSLAIEAQRLDVRSAADVSRVFEVAIRERVEAILVGVDGVTRPNRRLIIDLAARHKLPAIYAAREFADDGGLMVYGTNYPSLYFRAASFVDKILKGANPADIPVEQPTKFDLIVNLKTAKTLDLTVPYPLLARADEVIE
jgi:putative ABC transport system substrate-binding protein